MRPNPLIVLLGVAALAACESRSKRGGSDAAPPSDSALAADLRAAADTAPYSEAADVAMRDSPPDSTLPMPPAGGATITRSRTTTMRATPAGTGTRSAAAETVSKPPVSRPKSPLRPGSRTDSTPWIPVAEPPVRPAPGADASDYPTPACASPAAADQRRCLMAYLARSDATLDRNYQARIARLRSEAGTPTGAPDPESVQRLRTAQRAWLVYRDTECRSRNRGKEGALWAPVRARCLAEFSRARAEELR